MFPTDFIEGTADDRFTARRQTGTFLFGQRAAALPGRPKRTLRHQPRGFRMMPIADVKEARYGATIKVTRKNRENA